MALGILTHVMLPEVDGFVVDDGSDNHMGSEMLCVPGIRGVSLIKSCLCIY